MLTRKPNWQSELSEYLCAVASMRFQYGRLDCGLFVADAIEAMTGVDTVRTLRGAYRNRTEAFTAIRALCGRATMEAAAVYLTAHYGLPEVPVLSAQRGDVVQLRHGRRSSLGIIAMHGTEILTPYRLGILRLPLSHATRAWRV